MEKQQTEKCQAIMKATLELMADQGFHGTPTSQIATKAGVGVGTIYRYFKNKDELIHAIHGQLHNKMNSSISEGLDLELSDRDLFIQLIVNLINHLLNHPEEFKFLEQYYNSPFGIEKRRARFLEEEPTGDGSEGPFKDIIFRSRGESVKDLPRSIINALAFGPVVFILRDHLAGLIELNNDQIRRLAEGSWDAIKL
jgi:AcrR family transcriptional regulator